jgi:hypothetical protein
VEALSVEISAQNFEVINTGTDLLRRVRMPL